MTGSSPTGWQGPNDGELVRALRMRRDLRAGLVQFGYVLGGAALGVVLPSWSVGPVLPRTSVAPMLFGIAGGLLTFVALVFSLLYLVIQYGNTSVSPRLTLFRDDRIVWNAFGYFVGVFVFCTVAGLSPGADDVDIPALVPVMAIVMVMVALALSRSLQLRAMRLLQVNSIMDEIRSRGESTLRTLYGGRKGADEIELPAAVTDVRWSEPTALLRQVDLRGLLRKAAAQDSLVEVLVKVGDEVRRGVVVMRVHADRPVDGDALLKTLSTGPDRTFTQDPLLAFRLLVDIGNRSLSTAINDPATCVQALGHIYDLLAILVDRNLDPGWILDAEGNPRVRLTFPTWEDIVATGLDEIRSYAANTPTVQARLRTLIEDLVSFAPPDRHGPLLARLRTAPPSPGTMIAAAASEPRPTG